LIKEEKKIYHTRGRRWGERNRAEREKEIPEWLSPTPFSARKKGKGGTLMLKHDEKEGSGMEGEQ